MNALTHENMQNSRTFMHTLHHWYTGPHAKVPNLHIPWLDLILGILISSWSQVTACTSPRFKGIAYMCYTGTKCPYMTCCHRSVSADWSVTQIKNLKTQIGRGFQNNQSSLKFCIFLIFLPFSMNFWSWTFEFPVSVLCMHIALSGRIGHFMIL
jgi:hypothetical protein